MEEEPSQDSGGKTSPSDDWEGILHVEDENGVIFEDSFLDINIKVAKEDKYVRKAKEQQFRARNSLKLIEIDKKFNIFEGVSRAVDLFAHPGDWTQVLSRKLYLGEVFYVNDKNCLFYNELELHHRLDAGEEPEYSDGNENVVIVAVDTNEIPYYSGVIEMSGDLKDYGTAECILHLFDGEKADLVICKKLVEHTRVYCVDINFQANHVVQSLFIACCVLKPGGTLVLTIFKETDNDLVKAQLNSIFKEVNIFKPKSSNNPNEYFAICKHYSPPDGFDPQLMLPYLDFTVTDYSELTGINRILIPFLLCGDLSAYPLPCDSEETESSGSIQSSEEGACSSQSKTDELDHYMEKMAEAIANMGLQRNPDVAEMDTVKRKMKAGCSAKKPFVFKGQASEDMMPVFGEGPLMELIQKTTKLKQYPPPVEPEPAPVEDLQFLYEGDSTDSDVIKECLERVKMSARSSTCTCDDYFP